MRSTTPKVLHAIGGRTLLGHALATAAELDPERIAVVVRHERDRVAAHVRELEPAALVVDQDEIKGTGRAASCALEALDALQVVDGPVVVVAGDVPLLDSGTLQELLAAHSADAAAVTVLTTRVPDPAGYGRIVREGGSGDVLAIVEERDASDEQREIDEINTSVYAFDAAALRQGLTALQSGDARVNAQGEVYLTDVLALAREAGGRVRAIATDDVASVEGVNDRRQLAALGAELNRRLLEEAMDDGVTVVDPRSTWIDVTVELSPDVTLLPGVQLTGVTRVAPGATIGPDTTLTDTTVGENATVIRSHVIGAEIGPAAQVGPFTYLRPGAHLASAAKVGAFVEAKSVEIGVGAKVPHLSYVGDAVIGPGANVGAGVIVANYDGRSKHHTHIGAGAFVGSDSTLVAPVTVGDGAFVAAGSTLTRDVAPGDLAVERAPQRTVPGWVLRRLDGTPFADAARRAGAGSDGEQRDGADGDGAPHDLPGAPAPGSN